MGIWGKYGLPDSRDGLVDQPDKLGPRLWKHFVVTVYGVAVNIIFLPTGNRFKGIAHDVAFYKNMIPEEFIDRESGECPTTKTQEEVYTEAHH